MRYAIFSDVHANWEALGSVLTDAHEQGCRHHVCLGDIVGYNSDPGACVDMIRSLNCPVVQGNHDEDACLTRMPEELHPLAESVLRWTREHLTPEQKQWLRELKLVRQVRDFTIVHATLDSPGSWAYVANRFDAMASFSYQFTQLCFYGHTHAPRIYEKEKDGATRCLRVQTTDLRDGVKCFINVGSVGQPRDGDWRASYAIYDVDARTVELRRVEYDFQETRRKNRDAGLP